jgi:hypothetical protein
MITSSTIARVLQIEYNGSLASAFTIESDSTQYLVTAKHIFKGLQSGNTIDLLVTVQGTKKLLNCNVYFHDEDNIDIAVLKFNRNKFITKVFSTKFNNDMMIFGHDAYILGFPFGMLSSDIKDSSYPAPFVKKGCISAIYKENNATVIYADTVNNIGFSGGPMTTYEPNNYKDAYIIGVISGYRIHTSNVFDEKGVQTKNYVRENSGLTKAYSINHVFEIIEDKIIAI